MLNFGLNGRAILQTVIQRHQADGVTHRRSIIDLFTRGQLSKNALSSHLSNCQQLLELAVRSAQQSVQLINNFKQVATEQIAEQRRSFSVNEPIDHKLQSMSAEFSALSITVLAQIQGPIQCDSFPAALGQIVGQLLQNCAQHAFAARPDRQTLIHAGADTQQLILKITDNGIGMSNSKGLGLPICKRLASGVLGGDLTVSSQPDQGTCFTLRIPVLAPGYRPR